MKTDSQIQQDVMDELKWHPYLSSSEIGVGVKNGIVTLSGHVDSYLKKLSAEDAAKRVSGVKAVAEDIEIGVSTEFQKTDSEIAAAVVNALKWHTAVQEDRIKIMVENGNVKLQGEVEWEYQRNAAKAAVEYLAGVKRVTNLITVKPKAASSSDILKNIRAAFHRSATINASAITAEVAGRTVTLRGWVNSLVEKQDAEDATWLAAGIDKVINLIEVELPEWEFEGE